MDVLDARKQIAWMLIIDDAELRKWLRAVLKLYPEDEETTEK